MTLKKVLFVITSLLIAGTILTLLIYPERAGTLTALLMLVALALASFATRDKR